MLLSSSNISMNRDLKARQSRWGSLLSELEEEWDVDDGDNNESSLDTPAHTSLEFNEKGASSSIGGGDVPSGGGARLANLSRFDRVNAFQQWSTGGGGAADHRSEHSNAGPVSLNYWIESHGSGCAGGGDSRREVKKVMDASSRRKYLEKSVHILHSLTTRIVGAFNNSKTGSSEDGDIFIHPNFITVANVTVSESTKSFMKEDGAKISADFVQCGDSIFFRDTVPEDETQKKYLAMDALGRMAYEMWTLGDGPSIEKLCPSPLRSKGPISDAPSLSNALSIHDPGSTHPDQDEDEIIDMLRKNPRTITSEESKKSGIISAMLDANVSFPLCRFVSDLLDDAHESMFGRSEHSFSSFKDVLSDLKQMMDNPEGFLHASSPDRWKLVFGDKLYGRDKDTKAFLEAANRVAPIQNDPLFYGLLELSRKRREFVMVSGHSGAGKSRLVRSGGVFLEKRGWRFLRCKFDRVVHPEPLSILAYAFDEYFGSFVSSPKHGPSKSSDHLSSMPDLEGSSSKELQEICERLKKMISPEGLGILAKHIPSLHLILGAQLPLSTAKQNETMVASLFRKLIQVLSSEQTPILFFIDDLQWADPLSLALLVALVKGSDSDLLHLSSANENGTKQNEFELIDNKDDEIHIMFVGSYRDNEVDDNHPLAKIRCKFQSDRSINLTNISLSRFTIETLNEMLSESLCVPVRRVRSLSELVVQKTDGQPLHVIEFIQALTMDNLLTHSFARGWEWDADSIDICPITENVAELFAYKLQRLPKDILLGLQILSLFGSQIDQHVVGFIADYDREQSVDIMASIRVALTEGLIEQAAQLVSFAHDMIQKATIDSISEDDIIPLLRKISGSLIRNSTAAGDLDSILFVAVDLINRIGCNAITCPEEGELFAELNLRAGRKAIAVPDFAGGARYAENGISFLGDGHWETQYELSLCLYETAVLSHFSSMKGNRDQLKERINAVFERAKSFSDQFKTHCIWIKVLSMTNLSRAIEESLNALGRLGQPMDLANIDYKRVCEELVKCKKQFSGETEKRILPSYHMTDCNKVRAMKIMSSLMVYYHQKRSFLTGFVACKMIKMSMYNGLCEDSVFGAAGFASALVNILEDIDEGTAWGRTTLSLMKMYDMDILVPSIHAPLYGIVLVWKEPIQSTLEPLAQGIRSSFATGNVEFAYVNTIYYIGRSFNSGKNISVLSGEVEALARQHGNHFGSDDCSGTPIYSPLLQFYLTPLYNTLRAFEGDKCHSEDEEPSFPLDKVQFLDNDDIMKVTLEAQQFSCLHSVLGYQTVKAFMFRNMDSALKCTDLYFEHFVSKTSKIKYTEIYNMLYEALITLYFVRQTGEDRYQVRGKNALHKIREWTVHSDWNFKNKLLLVEAEWYNTQKDFAKAAKHYEASVRAAKEHKFIHEEAIASECAGIFFLERGLRQKSHSYFTHAIGCYEEWGAFFLAMRVKNSIEKEFSSDRLAAGPKAGSIFSHAVSDKSTPKKRQLNGSN